MLLALRMGKVGALVRVKRQAQAAFEGTQVIAKNIRILGLRTARVKACGSIVTQYPPSQDL